MNTYLANMIGKHGYNGHDFYELVKADTPQEAKAKAEKHYDYGYDVYVKAPIE